MLKTVILCFSMLISICLTGCENYNHDKADTSANVNGFIEHFGSHDPSKISGIYYYVDGLGVDSLYQMRFIASESEYMRLAASIGLNKSSGFPRQAVARTDLAWWPKSEPIEYPYLWNSFNGGNVFKIIWFNNESNECFYLSFSI